MYERNWQVLLESLYERNNIWYGEWNRIGIWVIPSKQYTYTSEHKYAVYKMSFKHIERVTLFNS